MATDRTLQSWRRDTLKVACPRCGAPPNQPCTNRTGGPLANPHISRLREARLVAANVTRRARL